MTLLQPADWNRDRFGRPIVNGKPYSRMSSIAKPLEDTYNLEQWMRRNVAFGLAHDDSLTARLLAVGGTPDTWDSTQKQQVNDIVEAANVTAKSHRRADIGTALHALLEQWGRGDDHTPGKFAGELAAVNDTFTAHDININADWVEVRIANHDVKGAGTADLIVERHGRRYIADYKTGDSVQWGQLAYAAQLAGYAGGQIWNLFDDTAEPTPDIQQDVGYIIHVPAGKASCTIHEIDLEAGRQAIALARQVKDIRNQSKKWLRPLSTFAPKPDAVIDVDEQGGDVDDSTYRAVAERYTGIHDETARRWVAANAISVRLKDRRTVRNWNINRGLVLLAEADYTDDDLTRAVLQHVVGDFAWTWKRLPELWPRLTLTQSATFADLCQAVVDGDAHITFPNNPDRPVQMHRGETT